jgi:hypothetical protein
VQYGARAIENVRLFTKGRLDPWADWRTTTTVIGGSLSERTMREPDAQQLDTKLPHLKSKTPGEGSELVEEPDLRRQDMHMQHLLRHERIRLVIIGVALLAIIPSAVFFLFTRSIGPLFITIVVVPLFYKCVDVYLDKLEAFAR